VAVTDGRPLSFYGWIGLGLQAVLLALVVAFVVAGVSYRDTTIKALHGGAQAMQIANLDARSAFLDAQRALQGFQVTREGRFLQTFYDDQDQFVLVLRQMRHLAWGAALPGVGEQARTALTAFVTGDQAVAAAAGSGQAARLYRRASALADRFVTVNTELGDRFADASNAFAAASGRTLGMGLAGTVAVLAIGVMLPMVLGAAGLRWASRPLHDLTRMVRRRAAGDLAIRVVPGGPADIRELSSSINLLADESDRLTAVEQERLRLQSEVREASTRIRGHLRAGDVVSEAVSAMQQHLSVDFVWLGLLRGGELTLAKGDRATREQAASIAAILPEEAAPWVSDLYQAHDIYCLQDLRQDPAREIPGQIRGILSGLGAVSLVVAPFGAGAECRGAVCLLRHRPGRPWSGPELDAVESLAGDIGRGLEHARLYESEARLVAELRAVDQAKTTFLASSSHDLRTPLTSITGYLEVLLDGEAGPVPPVQAKMLEAMSRNSRRLATLVEDMLTLCKIELGTFDSHLEPVDVTALVPAAADVLRPSALSSGIGFDVDCPERGLVVDGDPGQLDRVLINLLSNAVKYTQRGGDIRLQAGREGDAAVLTVTDTGMGIPEQDQPSVFTRFFRASNAVDRQIQGSGLGLSIVQVIVSNHGGHVELASAEGEGTTVTVRIPLLRAGTQAFRARVAPGHAGAARAAGRA
jgi:signal transduction histidine kinase/CHASE3 domain sensor protein